MGRGSKPELDWDEHNGGHVARHKVTPKEFEQVLANEAIYVETQIDENSGEERIVEIGHTDAGRVLIVDVDTTQRTDSPRDSFSGRP